MTLTKRTSLQLEQTEAKCNPFGTSHAALTLASEFSATQILADEIEPEDYIFEDFEGNGFISTTDCCQIYGGTGSGKTLFTLSLAAHVAAGANFIHWPCKKPRRVLYIDGELAKRTIQRRLALAMHPLDREEKQKGVQNLTILSRDILLEKFGAELAPLDTKQGQRQLLWLVDELKPDLIIFDSRFCLLQADMKEPNSMPKELILGLRSRKVAQWWVHHTGKDSSSGGYGDKTAEFLMDTVVSLSQSKSKVFSLRFSNGKCRNRDDDNEHFYRDVELRFQTGAWSASEKLISTITGSHRADSHRKLILAVIENALKTRPSDKAEPGTEKIRISRRLLFADLASVGVYNLADGKLSPADRKGVNRAIAQLAEEEIFEADKSDIWVTQKPGMRQGVHPH